MTGRGMMWIALFVTLVASLLYVRSRFLVVELSYDVSRRQESKTQLEQERRSLILELATLRNPRRVERIASQKLGLEHPSGMESVVILKEDSREVP